MLYLEKVRWKNLFAYGNSFTELELNTHKSTLFVGKNGSGKTTAIDAICYALYGKPFRKINKPQLVSSLNQKALMVELEFTTNNKKYVVRRGMKPNVFEIFENGELLNKPGDTRDYQEVLEKSIIKITFKSFTQIVILGSRSYIPFMQLVAADRRKIIEDLLDLEVFSKMFVIIKEKQTTNKQSIYDNNYSIDITTEKLNIQERHLAQQRENTTELIDTNEEKISAYRINNLDLHNQIVALQEDVELLTQSISDYDTIIAKQDKIRTLLTKLQHRMEVTMKDITFFHDHDNCPTCRQEIDTEFKAETVESKEKLQEELTKAIAELTSQQNELRLRIEDITNTQKSITETQRAINNVNNDITINNRFIRDLEATNAQLREQHNRNNGESSDVESLRSELEELKKRKNNLAHAKTVIDLSLSILKDGGIKSQIIKQYIPIMNKLINRYLSAMGFFVSFELDENFDEQIKSRHRDNFSYHSFSEGEKSRIDLAILFAWRDVAKMRNSASCNLLFMDEVFDGPLDSEGSDELIKILQDISGNSNIFIISHKIDQMLEKFERVLKFEKVKNYSQMEVQV